MALAGMTVGQALLASAAATAAVGAYQGNQAQKDQAGAADRARREAEMAERRANPNRPAVNVASLLAENTSRNSSLLTGPTGINPDDLLLGRTSLLGR